MKNFYAEDEDILSTVEQLNYQIKETISFKDFSQLIEKAEKEIGKFSLRIYNVPTCNLYQFTSFITFPSLGISKDFEFTIDLSEEKNKFVIVDNKKYKLDNHKFKFEYNDIFNENYKFMISEIEKYSNQSIKNLLIEKSEEDYYPLGWWS